MKKEGREALALFTLDSGLVVRLDVMVPASLMFIECP